MKALIEKLANGNVEYVLPKAEVSENNIELSVKAGEVCNFEFSIDTINDRDIKGVVFTNDVRVEVINNQFFGKHNVIKLQVSAKYLKAGTEFESNILITSNAGELTIPCKVCVTEVGLETGIGNIATLEEFMKLLAHDYEEALKLFLSKNFKYYLLKNDTYKCTLYERLIKNTNREIAMEEFLVAMKLKKQVVLSIANTTKEYENITEAYSDVFTITRSCPGYVDIDVEIEGDFLHNSKLKITNDDFVGNTYEYPYLINSFKLKQGENKARIILKTTTQTLTYDIVVKNPAADLSSYISRKKDILEIMKSYIDFRCGKIAGNKWIADMDLFADAMMKKNPGDMVAVLLKTQISILSGNEDKATTMLSRLSHMVNSTDPEKIEYYCYYLYLKTLHKKNASYTDDVKREIKTYFENGYDKWGLLWMIIYLDDRYTQNPSLKYTLIKEQFNKGCTSPVMYYEAINVLNEQPALLRLINPFELQILNFGAKKGIINEKLARQIMILLEKEKGCNRVMLRTLMNIYEKNDSPEVLNGICRMLINGGRKEPEYFKWYDKGVEADLKLAEMMEYYVYTISSQGYVKMRPSVYMYFGYSAETLGDYQAYLFADIIYNKNKNSDIYKQYEDSIKKYALNQLVGGNINDDLAVIYEDVLTEDFKVDEEIEKVLPDIVNSYEITVDNNNIAEVIVCHKETVNALQTRVINNKALVTVFTENPVILFVDNKGRKLSNIDYRIRPVLKLKYLEKLCQTLPNQYLEIDNVNKCMANPSSNKGKAQMIIKVWNNELINQGYKYNLSEFVVEYCSKNYDAGDMDDFLMKIDSDSLTFETRNMLMELLIKRGKYGSVAGYIYRYGVSELNTGLVLEFVSETIKNSDYAVDEKILELCRYLFMKDKYDAITLGYLQKYYEGPTDEMYDMWKACIELEIADKSFAQRLIVQTIFEGRNEERMLEIFTAYNEDDPGRNIKKAYYTYVAYGYFIKKEPVKDEFFKLMEKDIKNNLRIPEICQMAYLEYVALKDDISKDQIAICKGLIYELTEINIVFEFYKKFNKWFKMPYSILDKTIIDYRTNPKNKVYIMYTVYDEDGNAGKSYTEEMSSVYPGIFVKQLTMFYGEKVIYTIVDKNSEEIVHSKEQCISLTRKDIYNDENKFGQINGMLISDAIGREDALEELMKNYEFNRQASEELFKLL